MQDLLREAEEEERQLLAAGAGPDEKEKDHWVIVVSADGRVR